MSLTAKSLADLLYPFIDQSGTAGPTGDVTNATTVEKTYIALAINQALKDLRKLNPQLFVQRPGIVLRAPGAGTITVTQYSVAVTLGTLTVPSDGCTVRIAGLIENELNQTGTPGTYELRRQHDGDSGSQSAELWNDCWVAADGASYEAVFGEVKANGLLIATATSAEELEAYRLFSRTTNTTRRRVGAVRAVFCEQWASPYTNKVQTRLRFAPMPDAATVIDAALIIAAPVLTAANMTSTTITFQVPQGLDESILFPLAMKRFMANPYFRVTDSMRKELQEQAAKAEAQFRAIRGNHGAVNYIDTGL